MIGISKLYCGRAGKSDALRYGQTAARGSAGPERKPVVVWNCTQRCNLRCRHCYSSSGTESAADELSTAAAGAMIDDLAAFGVPVLLFSGGEPLLRADLPELIDRAAASGMRTVLSTNGTLITSELIGRLKRAGVDYVGVSLDGLADANDDFRGRRGAFDLAFAGIRNCLDAGIRVGVRMTMNRRNAADVPGIFDLVQREGIPRVCFYHLVYTGRGRELRKDALSSRQTRAAVDLIMDRAADLPDTEVLTVDNHADGPYVYLRLLREDPVAAERCLELLRRAGGNSSGVGIGCVSWNGDVLPDQFWRNHVLGNVREKPFSRIWSDPSQPLLAQLRQRRQYFTGRCARCGWVSVCNGNLRARAEAVSDDIWHDDPACYLTDEEIAQAT